MDGPPDYDTISAHSSNDHIKTSRKEDGVFHSVNPCYELSGNDPLYDTVGAPVSNNDREQYYETMMSGIYSSLQPVDDYDDTKGKNMTGFYANFESRNIESYANHEPIPESYANLKSRNGFPESYVNLELRNGIPESYANLESRNSISESYANIEPRI